MGSIDRLTIAVASGKGGTGKTLLATNLASVAAGQGRQVALVDCDAEAPNSHLFFETTVRETLPVQVSTAAVDAELCTACGVCRNACAYGAIRILGDTAVVFDELCHGCGVCRLVCPSKAITEPRRMVGTVEIATARLGSLDDDHGELHIITGRLEIGDVKTPEVIRAARRAAEELEVDTVFLDAPPGVACAAVAALRGADVLLLVTEPTAFGFHDLELSVRLARDLGVPVAIIVNRAGTGDVDIDAWAREREIPVLFHIPFDREIARTYAAGELVADRDAHLASELVCVERSLRALARSAGPHRDSAEVAS